ncbi:GGDEF domain-containing protein [Shewanella psychrotolerans]|uniref:GGDEF domain-containing protein n=1 Tax=Shewanella psychrotolerans TaxID=2864206 RepID=UPI001C655A94|nr:GGDEF domain-containing protein [Shewanella psychrotolerans]QYK00905.1 GGDEF domain-containing protein [Shewanella psychrotolerans]
MYKALKNRIFISTLLTASLLLVLCSIQARSKLLIAIDWFDVVTEGALLLLGLSWLVLMLQARPDGRVTRLLILGLLGYSLGCYMDLLDEFFIHQSLPNWFGFLEKLPTPIGLVTLTFGLWLWREEQLTINEQLRTREQFFRQHQLVDRVTKIYDASSMRQQINRNLKQFQSISLIMLDIDNFSEFNAKEGFARGDTLLTDMAQMLACQLRSQDLVCRFAGDRFIIMLPNTSKAFTQAMARHLVDSVSQLKCMVSYAMLHKANLQGEHDVDAEQLITQINSEIANIKKSKQWPKAV